MATEVATLIARLEGDVRDFDRDMRSAEKRLTGLDQSTKDVNRSAQGLGGQITGLGGVMRGVFAGAAAAAVLDFGKQAVDAASNLNESLNAIKVTFGPYASGIEEIGKKSAESFGMAQSEFNTFAVQFSAFGDTIAKQSGKSVVEVVDTMAGRIADFASVMNLDLAEATTVFQSALAGETEAFRRFGGDVSAAAVEVKAMEMGLGNASGELTEQEKILARYELIMEQTEKTAGDFAATSDEFANKQRILTAEWENAKASLGQGLLPALTDLMKALEPLIKVVGFLGEAWGTLQQSNQDLAESGNPVLEFVGNLADSFTKGALPAVINAAQELFGAKDAAEEMGGEFQTQAVGAIPEFTRSVHDAENATLDLIDAQRAAADPAFALFQAQSDLIEAQTAYNDALAEHGPKSRDAMEAALDLAEAEYGVDAAARAFAEAGGGATQSIDALVEMLTQAGVARDVIQQITDNILELNDTPIKAKPMIVGGQIIGRIIDSPGGGIRQSQHGGHLNAGQFSLVGEAGVEGFIPDVAGRVIPNNQLGGSITGGPVVIQLQVDGKTLARIVRDDLVALERRGSQR